MILFFKISALIIFSAMMISVAVAFEIMAFKEGIGFTKIIPIKKCRFLFGKFRNGKKEKYGLGIPFFAMFIITYILVAILIVGGTVLIVLFVNGLISEFALNLFMISCVFVTLLIDLTIYVAAFIISKKREKSTVPQFIRVSKKNLTIRKNRISISLLIY